MSEVVDLRKQLAREKRRSEFYRLRCEMIQGKQAIMRDPERTMVCDILANGALLPDPDGKRYGLVAIGENYILPCDVRLPPGLTIYKGCRLTTLLDALRRRDGESVDFAGVRYCHSECTAGRERCGFAPYCDPTSTRYAPTPRDMVSR